MQDSGISKQLNLGDQIVCKIRNIETRANKNFVLHVYIDEPEFAHLVFKALVDFGNLREWINHKKTGTSLTLTKKRLNEFENGKWVGKWAVNL